MTETELIEVLLHLSTDCGFPKAASAFKIASAVMKEPETKKRAEENAKMAKKITSVLYGWATSCPPYVTNGTLTV